MSPSLQEHDRQNDWSVGEVRDVAPALISPNGASSMGNVLLDEDGNPYRRGGSEYRSKEGLGSDGLRWVWDGYLKPGGRTVFASGSDFGVLPSDDESVVNLGSAGLTLPKQAATLEDLLYIGGGFIYGGSRKSAVYSTGTVTVTNGSKTVTGSGVTWNTLVDAGMLLHIGSERIYVVASIDSPTQITLRDAYEGSTGSGKAYTLNPIWTVGADPYETYNYVTTCAGRWVFASGRTIKFTEVDNPHTFLNSLGTINEHTVPEAVEINGLASLGQTVIVCTTGGMWTLDGLALKITDANGNAQHRLQLLSKEIILAGAAGIAGSGQRLVIPAADGIYLMDGVSQPVRISKPIDRLHVRRIADGLHLGSAEVYRGHYFLPYVSGSGRVKDVRVCRLDRPTKDRGQTVFPWSYFTGDAGETVAFATRATADPQEPRLLGAQGSEPSRVLDCSGFFEPNESNETDADGSEFSADIVTRDLETGSRTLNVVRAVRPRFELSGDAGSVSLAYSVATAKSGGAKFGQAKFGQAKFGGESGASFTVAGELGPSDGRNPGRLRINKRTRFIRFRIRTKGPLARFALRELDMAVRPSKAVRK